MDGKYTLGVEEEFQIVDRASGELRACVCDLLEAAQDRLGEQIKPEMLQSVIEATTHVCPDVSSLRQEVGRLRSSLSDLLAPSDLALVAAGTHPFSHWLDQPITLKAHYKALEENLQDVVRSILIFGLHVHVAVPERDHLIPLMNDARYFLPHLLALSTNSPFWLGRNTGLKSYRTVVWKQFPRSGIPDTFNSWSDFEEQLEFMARVHATDETRRVWWDLRPHPIFGTLEFRICDVPLTADETVAIAALLQALVVKLHRLHLQNLGLKRYERTFIEENKWRAARYGLDALFVDLRRGIEVPARDLILDLLEFVDDVVDELGSRAEIAGVERILLEGTGADRQLAIYKESCGDLRAVTRWLMQETVKNLS